MVYCIKSASTGILMTVSSTEEGFDVSCIANKRSQIDSQNQTIVFIEPITISKLGYIWGISELGL